MYKLKENTYTLGREGNETDNQAHNFQRLMMMVVVIMMICDYEDNDSGDDGCSLIVLN
jgi:hypothetical protein